MARKNEVDVWRRSDTGVQLLKVELERKVVKKSGHVCEVKLLPIELSNGDGRGVVITVTDGSMVDCVVVGVSVSLEDDASEVDVDAWAVEESAVELLELEISEKSSSSVSCRRCSQLSGWGLVSTCISPLASSSRKCCESAALADTHDTSTLDRSNSIDSGDRIVAVRLGEPSSEECISRICTA
jgi:hypothetical protein